MPIKNTTAEALGRALGGERGGQSWLVPGPGHSPKDRSLKLTDRPQGVVWHSFAGDNDQDIAAYLIAAAGGAEVARGSTVSAVTATRHEISEVARAKKIWAETVPIEHGSLADKYLRWRLLLPPYRNDVRFHPELHVQMALRPCIVSAIRHANTREITGLHITILTHEGEIDRSTKAPNGRSYIGKPSAGGIWPNTFDDAIIVAEGLETALSAEMQFGIPAVAATSSSFYSALYVPVAVRFVLIVADNDGSGVGLKAAQKLAERLIAEGRDVRVITPGSFNDANDVQRAARPAPVQVQLARKSQPLNENVCYGEGLIACGTAAITHPWLHEKPLKKIDGTTISRFLVYFGLCQRVASRDQPVQIEINGTTYEVILPSNCVIATRHFIAERYGLTPDTVRHFISKLAELGLASIRRPVTSEGLLLTVDGAPDIIELPARIIPRTKDNTVQIANPSTDNQPPISARGSEPFFARGVYVENLAISIGYKTVAVALTPGGQGQFSPQYFLGHEGKNFQGPRPQARGCTDDVAGDGIERATRPRVPLIDTFATWSLFIPPPASEMPWWAFAEHHVASKRAAPEPTNDPEPSEYEPESARRYGARITFKQNRKGGRPAGRANRHGRA